MQCTPRLCTGQFWSQGLFHLDWLIGRPCSSFARGIAKRTTSTDTSTQHHYLVFYQAYKIPSLSLSLMDDNLPACHVSRSPGLQIRTHFGVSVSLTVFTSLSQPATHTKIRTAMSIVCFEGHSQKTLGNLP